MKTLNILVGVCLLALMTSCGMSHSNFQKQKFTSLKTVKNSYAESTENALAIHEDNRENEVLKIEAEDNPKQEQIKKAIASNQTIVIHQGNQQYRLKNPVYDKFYDKLYGELEPVDADISFDSALEYGIDEDATLDAKSGIQVNNLNTYKSQKNEPIRPEEEEASSENSDNSIFNRPTKKERKSWPIVTKSEENQSVEAKRAKRFFGLSFLSIPMAVLAVILLVITWEVWPLILLVFAGIFFAVTNIIAFINSIKYKKQMDKKKKRMRTGMRILYGILFAGFIWAGILIVQIALSGLL